MTQNVAPAGDSSQAPRHAKSNSRVVPVIPRQLARKPKINNVQSDRTPGPTESKEPSHPSSNSSAISEATSIDSTRPTPSQSSEASSAGARANGKSEPEKDVEVGDQSGTVRRSSEGTVKVDAAEPSTEAGANNGLELATEETTDVKEKEHKQVPDHPQKPSNGPVELPAPFYPAYTPGPQSPPAGLEVVSNRNSFVFGGKIDSSTPSPRPPASAGSWASSAGPRGDGVLSPLPSLPANGTYKPQPPFTPSSSHSVQGHEPSSSINRPQFPPVFVPAPPPQNFTPNGFPQHQRQWTRDRHMQSPRSGSIGSNAPDSAYAIPSFPPGPFPALYHENAGTNDSAISLQRGSQYGPMPSFTPRVGSYHEPRGSITGDPDLPSLYALRNFTMDLFNDPASSDCLLQIASQDGEDQTIHAHSTFLSRSPKLKAQIAQARQAASDTKEIKLLIPKDATFRDHSAWNMALRFLYGGPPLRREHLPGNLKSPKQVLAWVLSYAVAGWYLQIPEIAIAGLGLASELMLVDNIDIALDFVLAPAADAERSGVHNGASMSSPADPMALKYAPFANDFIHSIARFIAFIISSNFEFDRSALQLPCLERIPEQLNSNFRPIHSSKDSASNPRLQGIQLGDFQLHSSVNRTMSSVLLSLPFLMLQALFMDRLLLERLSPEARHALLSEIVKEREHRRKVAVQVYTHMERDEQVRPAMRKATGLLKFVELVASPPNGEPLLSGRMPTHSEPVLDAI